MLQLWSVDCQLYIFKPCMEFVFNILLVLSLPRPQHQQNTRSSCVRCFLWDQNVTEQIKLPYVCCICLLLLLRDTLATANLFSCKEKLCSKQIQHRIIIIFPLSYCVFSILTIRTWMVYCIFGVFHCTKCVFSAWNVVTVVCFMTLCLCSIEYRSIGITCFYLLRSTF